MPRRTRIGALLGLLLPFSATASPPGPAGDDTVAAARARADATATLLLQTLLGELSAAVAEGGATKAVETCHDAAQALTQRLGEAQGVSIRRTALRTRNAANEPDAFERAWLLAAEAALAEGRPAEATAEVVEVGGGGRELRLLRPIVFPGGVCSQCHGTAEEISAEVRALLAERYPDDRAIGFRKGDLRGAVSVRVPLPAEPPR